MTATLRLFSIEARRNAAIWFVPVIVAVGWWLLDAQLWTSFLWRDTNEQLQQSVVPFAGPAMAGVAAWLAGRNRRRGIEDLLNSTPCPTTRRNLTLWASTALWGVVAYALFAVYMMGQTALQATWGGPAYLPVATVVLAILANAGWGFFVGGLLPSRFTAPLVGIGALGLQQLAAQHREVLSDHSSRSTWVNDLAAHNPAGIWQAVFYLGLVGAALAAVALKNRRDVIPLSAFTIAAALTLIGVVGLWGGFGHWGPLPARAYEPPPQVCKGTPITVCVSAEYEPVLEQAIIDATRLIEPLIGLSGVPMRIDDGRYISLSSSRGRATQLDVSRFADALVADDSTLQDGNLANDAQIAIRDWLQQRAGLPQHFGCGNQPQQPPFNMGWPTAETCTATERFSRLDPEEQRAWLAAHFTDLRAGLLTLADLP